MVENYKVIMVTIITLINTSLPTHPPTSTSKKITRDAALGDKKSGSELKKCSGLPSYITALLVSVGSRLILGLRIWGMKMRKC